MLIIYVDLNKWLKIYRILLLFSKNTYNCLKVTLQTFIMLQKMSTSISSNGDENDLIIVAQLVV